MVLLNSRIIWLEEIHLTYQFVNAFLDRIRRVMLNVWDKIPFLKKIGIQLSRRLKNYVPEICLNVQKVDYQWG